MTVLIYSFVYIKRIHLKTGHWGYNIHKLFTVRGKGKRGKGRGGGGLFIYGSYVFRTTVRLHVPCLQKDTYKEVSNK